MRQQRPPIHIGLTVIAGLALSALSGCVLTQPQVTAIQKFADATKNYGTTPASVITAYGDTMIEDQWVLHQAYFPADPATADPAWQGLQGIHLTRDKLSGEADRVTAALQVLDTYSNLLTTLSSDQFDTALASNATDLSTSLDSAIDYYNTKAFGANKANYLPDLGSTVAEAIRGVGGIFIRYKQEQALKQVVPRADQVIQRMVKDIQTLMNSFSQKGGYLDLEVDQLRQDFHDANSANKGGHVPQLELETFAAQLEKLEAARTLALQAAQAASEYGKAHSSLAAVIDHPENAQALLDQLRTLSNEVRAARDLKKQLDNKGATSQSGT